MSHYFVRVSQIIEVPITDGLTPSAALDRGREIWESDPTAHPATLEVFDHPSCEGDALDPEDIGNAGCDVCGTNDRDGDDKMCSACRGDLVFAPDLLRDRYFAQGEHPELPRSDWEAQVEDGETVLGYWEWLAKELAIRQATEE